MLAGIDFGDAIMAGPFARSNSGLYARGHWVPPQEASLALWLPFAGDANDASGNNRDFILYDGATYATDPDGTDTVLNLPESDRNRAQGDSTGLTSGAESTTCFWIRPRSYGQNSWGRIVSSGDDTSGTIFDLFLNNTSATKTLTAEIYTDGDTAAVTAPNSALTLDTWQMFCYTVKSGEQILYKGDTSIVTGSATFAAIRTNSDRMFIGCRGYDYLREFNGYVQHVMIWAGIALSASEVASVYNNVRDT